MTTTANRPTTTPDVSRFRRAQDKHWPRIARELAIGRKDTHWMWYVFPQLQGLAKSETANHFGIRDRAEALAYLDDEVLRVRLAESATAVLRHRRPMFGDTDRRKLQSCMTLFREVVADPALPDAVLAKWYGGQLCTKTLDILSGRIVPKPYMPPVRPALPSRPRRAPGHGLWAGTAQGRVETTGLWEEGVARVRASIKRAKEQTPRGVEPMSHREIGAFLDGLGLDPDVVREIEDRWVEDQNRAAQQGWDNCAAEYN